jgi:uncharacterized protein (TIGR03435 family)
MVVMMNARVLLAVGIIGMGGCFVLAAQTPASPTFEVASVKPNRSQTQGGGDVFHPGGRWDATNSTLRELIRVAYQRSESEIVGGPAWMDSDRFDVVAQAGSDLQTASDSIPPQMFVMIQTLLADRFKLLLHSERKDIPMYALVLARPDRTLGPQLRKTAAVHCGGVGAPCGMAGGPGHLAFENAPLSQLVFEIGPFLDRIVEDRTGLNGRFDGHLDWMPDPVPSDRRADRPAIDPQGPSLFTALQEQLGLKLESTRGPVDVLVIDHVEHPTED